MKWIALLWLIGATVRAASPTPGPASLDDLLDPAGALWQQDSRAFMAGHGNLGFRWVSGTHDTARAQRLMFHSLPVFETLARFDHDTLTELTLSLYNRGDAGQLSEAEFQQFMAEADEKLTGWAGAKGTAFKTQERTATATVHRKAWVREPYRVDLISSYTEKSRTQGILAVLPEYARLQIVKFDPQQDPRKSTLGGNNSPPKSISALELRQRVRRQPNGDVAIPSVPMVDQGEKGYCAAAVCERVLRYYGRNLDQHEIAQLARTSAGGGTSPEQMVAALRRISDETHMDVTALHDFTAHEFEQIVAEYNHAAKKAHQPEVEARHRQGNTIFLESPTTVYHTMHPDLLKEVRVKHDGPLAEFKSTVIRSINNGVPLTWGCVVGVVKEIPEMRGFGGHMRLIIGYNDRTQEILYTDTWGAGHELKRLGLADAWTITIGLYCLQPRDVHI